MLAVVRLRLFLCLRHFVSHRATGAQKNTPNEQMEWNQVVSADPIHEPIVQVYKKFSLEGPVTKWLIWF